MAEYKYRYSPSYDFRNLKSRVEQKARQEGIQLAKGFSISPQGNGFILSFQVKKRGEGRKLHGYLRKHPGFEWCRELDF